MIDRSRYVHTRVEPESAFLLDRAITGPLHVGAGDGAVAGVAPAAEIIDSRDEDFQFALADNSSSSGFVVGEWSAPDTPVGNLELVVEVDGHPAEIGSSATILGHPVRSLVEATRTVTAAGVTLEAGWIVLAGGATAAVPLEPGHSYRVTVERLGNVQFAVR